MESAASFMRPLPKVGGGRETANCCHHRHEQNPSADANIALIYVGLGEQNPAMIWLNKAYEARFNPSILLRPAFEPLRANVQFRDLRRRIGLPD
jgi:hypothetical protein